MSIDRTVDNGVITYSWNEEGMPKNTTASIRHREDGPAIEFPSGDKYWYFYGKLHREDGPAIECSDGDRYWYYYGEEIDCNSQEEFERIIKLKAFW